MKRRMVVLGAVHPVAGLLLFEVIPDSQVGYADIYQLTDSFNYADCIEVKNSAWRQHEPINAIIWEDIPVMIENVDGHCFISLCP